MNLSVIVIFRDNLSLIVFHNNLFLLSFYDNSSIPSSVFHDNPSGVFCDNPFVPSSIFRDNHLVSFMIIILFCLVSFMTIRLFCLVSFMTIHLFCLMSFMTIRLVSFVTIRLFRLVSSMKFVYYLPWQSFMSSSEDSLLLSCVAVRCLTLSSSVFFYSLWTLLKTVFCCPSWQSVVLPWALLYSFIMFHLLHGFLSFDGDYFSGIFISWTLLLFEDSTSCNSKLKVSSYCTLSLRGDVRDIYWAMRPKPSVGPLNVIEANHSS